MTKHIATRVAVASNRSEPLLGSGGGAASRVDKVWKWGGDNLLPVALSLLARRSVAHRRIINDKADYIAGKGVAYDEHVAQLGHLVECANGDGETLRGVLSRLAMDMAMFGNAFMEVVTDESHSFLSFYHIDASKCRVAEDSEHIVVHHDWSAFRAEEASTIALYPRFEAGEDGVLRAVVH